MGYLMNDEYQQKRVYQKEKVDDFTDDMMVDNSGMSEEFQSNIANISTQAHKKLSSLKKGKIYDWKTTNQSFLDLHKDLYNLGVKNNKFFLVLYDRDLQLIDPYSPALPLEMQLKVIVECMINPWYFLREIVRIPMDGSPIEVGGGSKFIADRNNIASWYCYLNGIDHYDSKPRQCGKTQNAIAEINYAFHFGALSATMLFFNKDQGLSKQNLYRLKCQRDMLPTYLQMKTVYTEDNKVDKGIDNITTMRNPYTNNTIKVMPVATSADKAAKLGRGETAAFMYHDEHDFTPYGTDIMDAAAFAYSKASENAAKNGSLYGRILTSTPGYLSTKEGRAVASQISRMLRWDDKKFYDMDIMKLKKILNSKSYNGIMYVEHDWKQLKKSIEWYETQCRLVDYKEDVILREIDLQRIQGNERSPFRKQDLAYISKRKRDPIEKVDYSKNLCSVEIFEKINFNVAYVLSVDPAEGLGLNNNAFTLINPHTSQAVAEFKSPYISPPDFFRLICDFLDKYCPKTMIVIEANRGRELINRFLESKYRYNLWYDSERLEGQVIETTDKFGSVKQAASERRAFGFNTTSKSKSTLFSLLENLVEENKDIITTPAIIQDIMGVIRMPNGKIVLGGGNKADTKEEEQQGVPHGDNLMSYLIGLYVLYFASNLDMFNVSKKAFDQIASPDSPEYKIQKMVEIADTLPPELQKMFNSVILENTRANTIDNYQQQVEREAKLFSIQNNTMSEKELMFDDLDKSDDYWKDFETRAYSQNMSNGYDNYAGNSQTQFNIDDWI